jgi:formylglycine-generating enzyme required for sulfatase activity
VIPGLTWRQVNLNLPSVADGLTLAAVSEENPLPLESVAVAEGASARRKKCRVLVGCALVVLGLAGWYFGVELPEQRAARELARLRAANARTIPDLKLDLVWIAPGEFLMGTPTRNFLMQWFYETREKLTHQPVPATPSYGNERPATWVTLTQPFWLGRTEVTQAQWTSVMGNYQSLVNGNIRNIVSLFKGDDLPIENVSWNDAMEFCRRLTERERTAGRLPAGHAYTLPTEAQWEYACRAGTKDNYVGDLDMMAWHSKNSGHTTHPVGTKLANRWGLADMHGNVWEWCLDWYADYPGGSVTNPRGPSSGTDRVYRGGGIRNDAAWCHSAIRGRDPPGHRLYDTGFRVALAPVR